MVLSRRSRDGYGNSHTFPEPEKQEPVTRSEASQADYILNTNTKKFHYPTCSSVNDMKEKNRQEFSAPAMRPLHWGILPVAVASLDWSAK